MKASILESIKPGKEYHIVQQGYSDMRFSMGSHEFSKESLRKAKELWDAAPGKFDGTLMGVIKVTEKSGKVYVEVAPMQYSLFRYIAKCRENKIALPKKDEILPIGITSITYYTDKAGKRYFLMGIKARGNIEGGKLEFVPQGFCNPPENKNMSTYIEETITRELQEELTAKGQEKSKIRFKRIENLALVVEDQASDYALQVECEVENKSLDKYNGITTEEHEKILIVSENELERALEDPTAFVNSKLPGLKKKSLEIQNSSKAIAYTYIIKHRNRFT